MSFKLEWHGDHHEGAIKAAIQQGLLKSALDLKQKSSDQAPVEFGDLRGNCGVDDSDIDQLAVRVGYSLVYALRQHEELGYNHPRGGNAKYLESPYNQNVQRYIANIGDEIRKVL